MGNVLGNSKSPTAVSFCLRGNLVLRFESSPGPECHSDAGSSQCLDRRTAYPPLRRATYCFSRTRKPHESDSVQFPCIPAFHRGRRRCERPTGCGRSGHGRCVSRANRCKSLRHFLVPRADFAWDNRVPGFHPLRKPAYFQPIPVGSRQNPVSRTTPSATERRLVKLPDITAVEMAPGKPMRYIRPYNKAPKTRTAPVCELAFRSA
jgi:hypothetical protein